MNKNVVILTAMTVVFTATADLTSWSWEGGIISPTLTSGTYPGAALTLANDPSLDPSYTGTYFDGPHAWTIIGVHDLFIAPSFAGGTYTTSTITSDASAVGPVWLVIQPSGSYGPGDFYGFGGTGTIIDLQPNPENASSDPQTLSGGDIEVIIQDIPEPSTIVLMGIAGSLVALARKNKFRLNKRTRG